MPDTSGGNTINVTAPPVSGGAANITAGASTGSTVGFMVGGPIGAGIGAAAGAVLGALTLYKAKTSK